MNPEFGTLDTDVAEAVALSGDSSDTNKPRLAGLGIYLEMPSESGDKTTQFLITSQGKNEKDEVVRMAVISRTVATWSPRKQWRVSLLREFSTTAEPMSDTQVNLNLVEQAQQTIKRQMLYGNSTLRNKPIVFELTTFDYSEIMQWKAPASALRRIQKARVALTFPEKVVS